jgi:HlyD family secretion protein
VLDHTAAVGQVVSGAPGLFTIASDLRRLRLHASVDEADIGQVKAGQSTTFTVDSFPGETFAGTVLLVKRAPQNVQNVVTYDVVIAAANPDQKLLPGMTATTQIVTGEEDGVLRVPSAALRFKPESERDAEGATVWTVGAEHRLVAHRVQPGRSDGALTAITAPDLAPGDGVVIALAAPPSSTARSHSLLGL